MQEPIGGGPLPWTLAVGFGGVFVAALFVIVMMLHVCADVFSRLVLGRSLHGTIEIVSAYYMVGVIFLPLIEVTREDGHISVELLTRRLPPQIRHARWPPACLPARPRSSSSAAALTRCRGTCTSIEWMLEARGDPMPLWARAATSSARFCGSRAAFSPTTSSF